MRAFLKLQNEAHLDAIVEKYLRDNGSEFAYGGVSNLLYTIADVLRILEEETGCEDYGTAYTRLLKVSAELDLKYESDVTTH